MKRDFATLDRLMARYVHPLYAIRDRAKGYEVAVMKEAMEILGMSAGTGPAAINELPAGRRGGYPRINGCLPGCY